MTKEARSILKDFKALYQFAEYVEQNSQIEQSLNTNKADIELLKSQREGLAKELDEVNVQLKAAKLELESSKGAVKEIKDAAHAQAKAIIEKADAEASMLNDKAQHDIARARAELEAEKNTASAALRTVQDQITVARSDYQSIVDSIRQLKEKIGA